MDAGTAGFPDRAVLPDGSVAGTGDRCTGDRSPSGDFQRTVGGKAADLLAVQLFCGGDAVPAVLGTAVLSCMAAHVAYRSCSGHRVAQLPDAPPEKITAEVPFHFGTDGSGSR